MPVRVVSEPMQTRAQTTEPDYYTRAANDDYINGRSRTRTKYAYEGYGNTTSSGATSANALQYGGRENDGTGLYYNRARYYSPTYARFISADPIGFAGGMNLYAYANGNPISVTDPLGLMGAGGGGSASHPGPVCDPSEAYWDRYRDFVSQYAINVGPAAAALAGGVMPKSFAPAGAFRGPLLGSSNPLTSVIRGMTGYTSPAVQSTAEGIGVATVGIGMYDATIELEGLYYAADSAPSQGNSGCGCRN